MNLRHGRSRRIKQRPTRNRSGFERLEPRALLRGENVFQSFSGTIEAPGERDVVAYTIDPDFFSPSGRSVLLGLHVQAADGSNLDPAAVEIRRVSAEAIAGEFTRPDQGEGRESLVLAELGPGNYELAVQGEGGTTGSFVLDIYLVGDADGNQAVNRADVAAFTASYGGAAGIAGYRASADANLDGLVSLADLPLLPRNLDVVIRPATIVETSPANGEEMVSTTRETIVRFDERIDAATVTTDSFYLVALGNRISGRVSVSSTERFATFFYDDPLPASTEVRVVVDGNLIRGRDGALLDADGDGVAGGVATADFRTLPLTRIPGTNIFGYVYDSYHTNPDGSNIPIVGATIRVDAFPEANTTTDGTGYFILRDMPAPEFFVHIDGTTATNAPAGTMYPSVGKPFHTVPGQEVQLSMMGMPFNIYLPPMAAADVVTLDPAQDTPVGFGDAGLAELATMFPELDPAVWDRLNVTFPAGSAVDDFGNPATQAVVIPVPPDRIPAPLPPFMDPALVISIQAIGATNFDVPAPVSFPNLDGLLPGEQSLIMSFDHDAGRWKSIGTATVSADGLSLVSDPGVGIEAPGWHFPFPGGNNDGNSPSGTPCSGQPDQVAGFMTSEAAGNVTIGPFTAPPAGGAVKKIRVRTTIDGPIRDFVKPLAVGANTLNLAGSGTQVLSSGDLSIAAGSSTSIVFQVAPKTYDEVYGFGSGGFANQMRDRLYGSRIRVEVREIGEDSELVSRTCTNHFLYRWIDVVDAAAAQAKSGFTAAFHRTFADGAGGFVREKQVELRLPNDTGTTFTGANPVFKYDASPLGGVGPGGFTGTDTAVWKFDPPTAGDYADGVQIRAGGTLVGGVNVSGMAKAATTVNVNVVGYRQELKRVILALQEVMVPNSGGPGFDGDDDGNAATAENLNYAWLDWGPDGMLGGGDDVRSDDSVEVIYAFDPGAVTTVVTPGDDHMASTADDVTRRVINFTIPGAWRRYITDNGPDMMPGTADDVTTTRVLFRVASRAFKDEFPGFMPSDRQDPGADMVLGTNDDQFTPAQLTALDAHIVTKANELRAAIQADYDPINGGLSAYQFVDTGGDVFMNWKDALWPGNTLTTGYPVFGSAPGDYGKTFFCPTQADYSLPSTVADCPFLADPNLPIGAKMWALAQGINPTVQHNSATDGGGEFGVSINIDFAPPEPRPVPDPGPTFAQYIANTVSHEVAHTFGLIDAYSFQAASPAGATAGCNAAPRNCIPFDIMQLGTPQDPNLTFLPQNTVILKAALGMHGNAPDTLKRAVEQYRKAFNLADSEIGIRENGSEAPFGEVSYAPPTEPHIGVIYGDRAFFGSDTGDRIDFGVVVGDGPGGGVATLDFEVRNVAFGSLDITAIDFAGSAGFSVIDTGLIGSSMAVGQSATLRLAFDPATPGELTDTLRIHSNTPNLPVLEIGLAGRALPADPTAVVTLIGNNNLGLVQADRLGQRFNVIRVENIGAAPLMITDVRPIAGDTEFNVLGWEGIPIEIPHQQAITLGFSYSPSTTGVQRGVFELVTNDPQQPAIRIGAIGAQSDTQPSAGDDFVAVSVAGNPPLHTKSNSLGAFTFILPPDQPYHVAVFDPVSGMVAEGVGVTASQAQTVDITEGLVFNNDSRDSDFDGLPDDAELAIGTGPLLLDTDGDGIDDLAEISQGLDPLDDRGFPTGIISVLPLGGKATEIVVEGTTAYLATGDDGLALVDVGQFNNPILLGQIDLPGVALDVAVDPALQIAVVATQTGLAFVNVSDPMTPTLVMSPAIRATHVEVAGGLAYAVSGNSIWAVDIVTGDIRQTTELLGSYPITGFAREGTALFIMDVRKALRAIDTSTGEMVARGSLTMLGGGGRIFVGGGIVYAAAATSMENRGGYATADVSNLDALVNISGPDVMSPSVAPSAFVVPNGSGLALLGGVAGQNSIFLMDASDPANTFDFVTRIEMSAAPASAALASGIAFVAGGDAGLVVVNYVSFDSAGQPPMVTATALVTDTDAGAEGFQVHSTTVIPVLAEISDDVQVARTELLVDGVVIATDTSFPYDFFVTRFGASGATQLQVRATDTGGNSSLSNLITLDIIPDLDPPTITSVEPAEGAQFNAEEGRNIVRLLFSERMESATLDASAIRLQNEQGTTLASQRFDIHRAGRLVEISYPPFAAGNYRIVIDADRVTDLAGNPLGASDLIKEFTVLPDENPPSLLNVAPTDNSTTTAGLSVLALRFSEPMSAATLGPNTLQIVGPSGPVSLESVEIVDGGRRVRLLVPPLPPGDYDLTIDAPAVTDLAGNALNSAAITSQFTLVDATIFPDPVDFVGSGEPVFADINEDGRLDRLTGSGSVLADRTIYLDLGGDVGRFPERRFVSVAPFPSAESEFVDISAIRVADFNGDDNLDLFVASTTFFQRFVAVLLGDGTGSFVESFRFATGGFPNAIGVAQMDTDSDLDLVVGTFNLCCPAPNDGNLRVFSGRGDGMFDASEFVSLPNGVPRGGLGLADVDQDGDTDVAIAQLWQAFRRTSLIVLENDGTGDLTQSLSIDTGREVSEIFAGDVNSDDRLDIVFSPAGGGIPSSSAIGVIYGNEQGGFDPFEQIPLGNTDRLIAMLDIDDDGDPDLITGHSESAAGTFGPEVTARGLEVFTSDGAGGFSLHGVYPGPRTPSDLTVGDLDQDGDDDLLSFSSGIAEMLTSNGDGTFDGWEPDLAADDPPRAAALGDLDADGDLDLVSTAGAQYQQGTVSVRLGQGNGQFGPPDATNISDGTVTPGAVVTGDIDGDGDLDVVTANRFAGFYGGGSDGAVSVLLGNGSGELAAPIDIVIGSDPAALALGDIDGDGDLDIVATTRRSYGGGANAVVVLTNIGAAQFAEPLVLGLSAFPAGLALGDVDNDDDLDIVTANGHTDISTSLFRNRGNGQFDPPEVPISGASTESIALADLDGDDDLDLLVSNSSEQIAVALGGGATSGFAPAELYPIGLSARAMSVADLDGDGHLDVALITGNGLVVVAAGLGDGTLGAVEGFSAGLGPVSLALGDLDNDSDLDILTANLVSSGFSVRLNSTMLSSGFSPVPAPSAPVRSVIAIAEGTPEGTFNDHPVVRKLTASRIDRAIVEWPDAHTSSNSASDRLLASRQRPRFRQRTRGGLGDLLGVGVDSP